jgi:hypothetical protein
MCKDLEVFLKNIDYRIIEIKCTHDVINEDARALRTD